MELDPQRLGEGIPRLRLKASEAASEAAFALLDALWHGPTGLAIVDRELRFVRVNDAFARMTALPPDDHLGRTMVELPVARDGADPLAGAAAPIEALLRSVVETGRPELDHAIRARSPDGVVREWLASYFPVLGPGGETRGVCSVVVDATEGRERQAALERARTSAERSAGRFRLIAEIAGGLAAAVDPREVADAIVTRLAPALGACSATVRILRRGVLELLGHQGYPRTLAARFGAVPLGAPLPFSDALERGEAIWLETREEIERRYPGLAGLEFPGARGAWVAAPLLARGKRLGALGLIFTTPRRFDLEDRALVLAIAEQCALALDRALLFEAERDQRSSAQHATGRVRRLQAMTAALSAARTVDDVGSVIALQSHESLGVEAVAAYVLRRDGSALRQVAALGLSEDTRARLELVRLDARLPQAECLRAGAPVWLSSQDSILARYPALGEVPAADLMSALAALPLRSGGVVWGAVLFGLRGGRRFAPEDRELLETVADQSAQALERAELFDAERGARDEAERARGVVDAIVENAPVGIAVLDLELRFVRVNPVLAEMNGLPVEAHLGRTVRELFPKLPHDVLEAAWRRLLETGAPVLDVELEGETPAAPGKARQWVESWYPIRTRGEVTGIGVLVREVTAERQAQEFQRHVLGVVGHDLRNPLAAISTSAQLLERARDPAAAARIADRIRTSTTRMERIIEVLLDYTRVRGGQAIPLRRRGCDVAALCRAAVDESVAAHPGRVVRLRADGGGAAEWDPDRIAQVLANLLGNALEHGAADAPAELECRVGEDAVELLVSNDGAPIPPELLPRLFQPFRRAGNGEAPRPGLGLGLFIARAIVHAHGGEIEVRSPPGGRTVFEVRLPRSAVP